MNHEKETVTILNSILNIDENREPLQLETRLLGAVPEFDSMAVIGVVEALEDHFGFSVNDDELTADIFLSVGTIVNYVEGKLRQ